MNNIQKIPKNIQINPDVRFGKPTIAGTRIAVEDILLLLESGYRIDEIPKQYPPVTLKAAKQAVRYAASVLGKEETLTISA